jgi:hypothetical protein
MKLKTILTAPTGRAEKPMPFAAHVAGCCTEIDRIAFVLPFAHQIPGANDLGDSWVVKGGDSQGDLIERH